MNKYLILLLVISYSCLTLGTCEYSVKSNSSKISWTAFKLAEKVGVKGWFETFKLNSHKKNNLHSMIHTASFSIDAKSVKTGNMARDIKISKFFFSTMKKSTLIKGKVINVDEKLKQIEIELNMNGIQKKIKLNYIFEKEIFVARGEINIFDFAMDSEFKALSKACELKHKGKTWPDVMIEVSAEINKKC